MCLSCKEKNLACKDFSHILSEPYDSVDLKIRTPDADLEGYVHWEVNRE